jgi:hypothetical protein
MKSRNSSIAFLKNDRLKKAVLNLHRDDAPDQNLVHEVLCLEGVDSKNLYSSLPDIAYYRTLAEEYDRFILENVIDNIHFKIIGIDQKPFVSASSEEEFFLLIQTATNRIKKWAFLWHIDLYESGNHLEALWFPPRPISLGSLSKETEKLVKANIINFLNEELGLMVADLSICIIDGGGSMEEWFFDHYFVPNQTLKALGLSERLTISQYHPCKIEPGERTVLSYLLEGEANKLKDVVNGRVQPPFSFEVDFNMPDDLSNGGLFMPHFRVCLNPSDDVPIEEVIEDVNKRFDVLDSFAFDGRLYLQCTAHEGPFAHTPSEIVANINEVLGPFVLKVLKDEMGLDVLGLQFILSYWY